MSEWVLFVDYMDLGRWGKLVGNYYFWILVVLGFVVIIGGLLIDWFMIDVLFYLSVLLYVWGSIFIW